MSNLSLNVWYIFTNNIFTREVIDYYYYYYYWWSCFPDIDVTVGVYEPTHVKDVKFVTKCMVYFYE